MAATQGLKGTMVLQVQPETKTVVIATPDLRGSIVIGSTVVAYATDQLATLGNAMVKGMKQVRSSVLKMFCTASVAMRIQLGKIFIKQ